MDYVIILYKLDMIILNFQMKDYIIVFNNYYWQKK